MGIDAVLRASIGVIKGVLNGVCGSENSGLLNVIYKNVLVLHHI